MLAIGVASSNYSSMNKYYYKHIFGFKEMVPLLQNMNEYGLKLQMIQKK